MNKAKKLTTLLLIAPIFNALTMAEWGSNDDLVGAVRSNNKDAVKELVDNGWRLHDDRSPVLSMALRECCSSPDLGTDIVKLLLDSGVNPNGEGATPPLSFAIAIGCPLQVIQWLLEKGANVKKQEVSSLETALHVVARNAERTPEERLAILKLLLKHKNKAVIDGQDSDGVTPLWIAAEVCNPECVEYLLKLGAQDVPDFIHKKTALQMAQNVLNRHSESDIEYQNAQQIIALFDCYKK